ncbi:methyltransferase family protein [Sphingobium nicotianae]|uniref:Isoprenylcysteine carboxylmethyltransferase family protein n=1 Tax=Sphingobium nicotianae TaxID=2782607 RepID=A0A9X1IPQ9_9SPHN|nr:isoprenylcysteine carboxylmethyltransferase family protein [Sphingobium nicotianae]MBT2186252.1 isoprenylcysteine carboxylmethyltransferase family protein [Sphingobium nicotianae]
MKDVQTMQMARYVLMASWLLFMLVWLAFAFTNKRTIARETLAQRLGYFALMFIGVSLMAHWPSGPLARMAYFSVHRSGPLLHWLGALCGVAGAALAIWARLTLGRNWSGTVTVKEDHELVTTGPYAVIRHPIYTALTLLFLGILFFFPSLRSLLGLAFIIASFWVKLRQEEALMLAQFPDAYPAYCAHTTRLIPWLV